MILQRKYAPNEFDYLRNVHDQCRRYMNHHVTFETTDGHSYDGIIEHIDRDRVSLLIGEDIMDYDDESPDRQYYGGYPRSRFRRFRRRIFPLAVLGAISLYPYYSPYPYPYSYHPYYPY